MLAHVIPFLIFYLRLKYLIYSLIFRLHTVKWLTKVHQKLLDASHRTLVSLYFSLPSMSKSIFD
jgi:hypothetical protein